MMYAVNVTAAALRAGQRRADAAFAEGKLPGVLALVTLEGPHFILLINTRISERLEPVRHRDSIIRFMLIHLQEAIDLISRAAQIPNP